MSTHIEYILRAQNVERASGPDWRYTVILAGSGPEKSRTELWFEFNFPAGNDYMIDAFWGTLQREGVMKTTYDHDEFVQPSAASIAEIRQLSSTATPVRFDSPAPQRSAGPSKQSSLPQRPTTTHNGLISALKDSPRIHVQSQSVINSSSDSDDENAFIRGPKAVRRKSSMSFKPRLKARAQPAKQLSNQADSVIVLSSDEDRAAASSKRNTSQHTPREPAPHTSLLRSTSSRRTPQPSSTKCDGVTDLCSPPPEPPSTTLPRPSKDSASADSFTSSPPPGLRPLVLNTAGKASGRRQLRKSPSPPVSHDARPNPFAQYVYAEKHVPSPAPMVSTRSLAKRARARDVGDADGTDGDDPPAAKRRRAGVATVTASIEPTTSKTRTSRKKVITTVPNQQVLANSFATPERSRKDPKPATKGAPVSRAVAAKAAEIIDLSDSSDEQTPTQQKPRETVTSTESTSALSLAQNAVRRRGSALALDPDCRERTVSQRTAGGLDHEERKLRSPETGSSASGFSQPRPSALPLGAFVPNGLLGFDMSRDERGHSGANVVGADEDDPIEGDDDHAFFRRKPPPSKRDTVMAVSKVTAGASVSASAFTLRSTRELDGSDNQSNVKDDGGGYEGSLDAILAGWRIPEPPLDDAERSHARAVHIVFELSLCGLVTVPVRVQNIVWLGCSPRSAPVNSRTGYLDEMALKRRWPLRLAVHEQGDGFLSDPDSLSRLLKSIRVTGLAAMVVPETQWVDGRKPATKDQADGLRRAMRQLQRRSWCFSDHLPHGQGSPHNGEERFILFTSGPRYAELAQVLGVPVQLQQLSLALLIVLFQCG